MWSNRSMPALLASPPASRPSSLRVAAEAPSFSPLYQQIKTLLVNRLQAGEWRPGEAIPSEIELAGRFGVSQGTVRKAIDAMAADNLLIRRQGKGTFVATHAEQQVQFRFLRLAPDSGRPVPAERRFIDCERLRAPADVSAALALRGGASVIKLRRSISFRGQPEVLDDIWLPHASFKGLTAQRLSDYRGPMYGLFETEFGVRMIRAQEKLRAVAASAEAAKLLGVAPGTPLLSVERLTLTYGDRPVELRRGLYRTESYHYRNELS
jgi:GntR family transcriptional regulator